MAPSPVGILAELRIAGPVAGVLQATAAKIAVIYVSYCFQSTFPGLEMKKPPRRRFFRPKQQSTE